MHYKLRLQPLCAAVWFSLKDCSSALLCALSKKSPGHMRTCHRRNQHAFALRINCPYLLKQKCYSSMLVISVYHLWRTQLLCVRLSCRKLPSYEIKAQVNFKIIFISLGAFITRKLIQYNLKSYFHAEEALASFNLVTPRKAAFTSGRGT